MIENTNAIDSLTKEIKHHLENITQVTDQTLRDDSQHIEINYLENPLNPNLLAYCFDVILGFDVRYKIFEKVNYYYCFIKNTKWHWESKIQDVCGASMPDSITSDLHRIKEIYRNHNAHSRKICFLSI